MDETATKNVIEAALLAAGRPITFDKLVELFSSKGVDVDRGEVRSAIKALGDDYTGRGIELKEVASGFRIQVRSNTRDWLDPLFEERAPRYTRALLETLALVAYRQPITRAEIEDIRGVVVSTNIVRTLIERGWVRVVGYRDVPGKPSMLGTTKEFLDYFGLKRLEDLPPLAEIKDFSPATNPQSDLVDVLEEGLARALEEGSLVRIESVGEPPAEGAESTTAEAEPADEGGEPVGVETHGEESLEHMALADLAMEAGTDVEIAADVDSRLEAATYEVAVVERDVELEGDIDVAAADLEADADLGDSADIEADVDVVAAAAPATDADVEAEPDLEADADVEGDAGPVADSDVEEDAGVRMDAETERALGVEAEAEAETETEIGEEQQPPRSRLEQVDEAARSASDPEETDAVRKVVQLRQPEP